MNRQFGKIFLVNRETVINLTKKGNSEKLFLPITFQKKLKEHIKKLHRQR